MMKIRFKGKDPRAGTIVELDNFRAQELIEAGAAEAFEGKAVEAAPENKAIDAAPENKAKQGRKAK